MHTLNQPDSIEGSIPKDSSSAKIVESLQKQKLFLDNNLKW